MPASRSFICSRLDDLLCNDSNKNGRYNPQHIVAYPTGTRLSGHGFAGVVRGRMFNFFHTFGEIRENDGTREYLLEMFAQKNGDGH